MVGEEEVAEGGRSEEGRHHEYEAREAEYILLEGGFCHIAFSRLSVEKD